MRIVLLAVALAFVNVRVSHAEVLVYQGKGKAILPNIVSQDGKKPSVYYVIDVPGRTAYPLFYFTLAGQKRQRGAFP